MIVWLAKELFSPIIIPNRRAQPGVPLVIRWPRTIKPGTIYNDIIAGNDWMPTRAAAGCFRDFLTTIPEYPFQMGSSLSAAGINYDLFK